MYPDPRSGLTRQVAAVAAVFAIGLLGGCLLSRPRDPDTETTHMLVAVIRSLVHSQNSGPIIAAGITAGAAVLCAVLVPLVAVLTLERVPKSRLPSPRDELPGRGAPQLPENPSPTHHPVPTPRRR
ncbi:MAG: hypothetical protein FJ280_08295 [Planctomycetes bacterium]|nr:hypothetical protein [Planctomycetota bacterium]